MVDGLEKRLKDEARLIRLDITQSVGQKAALQYGVRAVPTFVLLDSTGSVLQRYEGFPPRDKIEQQIQNLEEA